VEDYGALAGPTTGQRHLAQEPEGAGPWRIRVRLPSGRTRAYRLHMTRAARLVWIVIAVMLVLALLNAVALALISPGS
jgi:hypothetical protein